jgi:signal transduction histidine kinase
VRNPRSALRRTRLRLPIRLKLAVVSAGLTFVILLLFAVVVGALTENRVKDGFNDDLRATAADLQEQLRVQRDLSGEASLAVRPETLRAAAAGGAVIRVVDRVGSVLNQTRHAPDLGAPVEGSVRDVGDFRVVARPLFAGSLDRTGSFRSRPSPVDGAVAFVQYAKPRENLQGTLGRLHLFLALGVLGGTGLAFLAGFAVARRAMRPIAGLTQAASEVARTRDPAISLPKPEAKDEVAKLAHTLEDMLRELDAARTETEAALERQREFVADASHELRTPLTSILANLELLEEELTQAGGPEDREAAAEIAGSALRSSHRMRRLVGDLLLLARADAGRQAPRRPVNLSVVIRDAVREAQPLASGHTVTLDLPAEDDAPTVVGSADDLHRLVLNLVENAYLHTPPGTPVVVSVQRAGAALVMEVADRGPGVKAEMRGRVFERFTRKGGDTASGSGLGLSIVRAVADSHAGTVEVREAEGGGAVFAVTLPAAPLRSPNQSVPSPEPTTETDPEEAEAT